jgi:acyl-CoA synthetase (AMP-forming)/AMP-acid ligase II
VREELERLLGAPLIEGYANTEAGTITINIPPRPGSVGLPVIEELAIIDDEGNRLGPGRTGEILVRGTTVFEGYENAPDETSAVLTGGWFRTGDLGYCDIDGYLFLTGRKKELINKGGEKIPPAAIDAALLSHPDVMDAMAFPLEDPVLGEEVGAMVVRRRQDLTENQLRRHLLDLLNPSLLPGRIFFVESVPRNSTGKVLREQGTRQFSPRHRR